MEVNLQIIRETASSYKEVNTHFKNFLRTIPNQQVDRLVHELNIEVSNKIDCTSCGNCCKILEPPVSEEEIDRLAKVKGLNNLEFEDRYVKKESLTNIQFLSCQPCIFLHSNSCTIYEERPASCADYPHLHHPNFKYRWKSVMANYSICPIVFNVVELLKLKLNYTTKQA